MRTLTSTKGKTVETNLTDAEALRVLGENKNTSAFGCDLVRKAEKYGLSADQNVWVHVLAAELSSETDAQATVNLAPIVMYLTAARGAGIKWPRIRLVTADMRPVVLSLAGSRAKQPGTANITDGGPYGENQWYGRVALDGDLESSREIDEGIVEILQAFSDDPARTAKAQGSLTSACCFCGKELTTMESVGAGYGPICAGRWNLPWGEETAAEYKGKKEEALRAAEEATKEVDEDKIDKLNYSKCPVCGYWAFNGVECFDCGYRSCGKNEDTIDDDELAAFTL